MIFLDSNVIIYTADISSDKKERALDLLTARPCVSVQAINEAIAVLRRKKSMAISETAVIARNLMRTCEVYSLTASDIHLSLELSLINFLTGMHWLSRMR